GGRKGGARREDQKGGQNSPAPQKKREGENEELGEYQAETPPPRPPHLRHETTRHRKRVWYVRIHDRRVRLRADYGTDEFWSQYHAAVNGEPAPLPTSKTKTGSLAWLIERYRETSAWMDLSSATRRNRENHF